MTVIKQQATKPFFTAAFGKRALVGAGIGLVMISFFVIGAGKGNRPGAITGG